MQALITRFAAATLLLSLILLLLLLLTTSAAADDEKAAEITVRPLLCIVDQRTPSCDMVFHIAWRTDERGYYCVLSNLDEVPLRCWSEQRAGQHRDDRSVAEDFVYMINEGDGAPPLDSVTVEVVRMDSEDRRRRRRTRHVWDLL